MRPSHGVIAELCQFFRWNLFSRGCLPGPRPRPSISKGLLRHWESWQRQRNLLSQALPALRLSVHQHRPSWVTHRCKCSDYRTEDPPTTHIPPNFLCSNRSHVNLPHSSSRINLIITLVMAFPGCWRTCKSGIRWLQTQFRFKAWLSSTAVPSRDLCPPSLCRWSPARVSSRRRSEHTPSGLSLWSTTSLPWKAGITG